MSVCKYHVKECTGCLKCQEISASEIVGRCAWCGDDVHTWDDRFVFPDGAVVHDDCVIEYIYKHYRLPGGA